MSFNQYIKDTILQKKDYSFEDLALEVFTYQANNNRIYKEYLSHLKVDTKDIQNVSQIPFLPIEFFKYHDIICKDVTPKVTFRSSGTTGQVRSQHLVADPDFYQKASLKAFEELYGDISEYNILALLPNYLEKGDSSLVYMVEYFIAKAKPFSGFYLNEVNKLLEALKELKQNGEKVLLIGVTFALLDLAEQFPMDLSGVVIMETGGMKGRRREMLRAEVHQILKQSFQVAEVHSEYGMTELLSQGYSLGNELFTPPEWMRIKLRDVNDPFSEAPKAKAGGINVIDLANIDSCSFIETKDIGKLRDDNSFEVLGRFDNSDIRGCNLMVSI